MGVLADMGVLAEGMSLQKRVWARILDCTFVMMCSWLPMQNSD